MLNIDRNYSYDSKIVTVTPELAAEWLQNNTGNRALSKPIVDQYARAMADARWRLNGETIKIAVDGKILDGQHRLQACIIAGQNFQSYVISGLDRDLFDTIDVGKKRSAGDILGMEGCRSAYATAAAIRWVALIRSGAWHVNSMKMTADEIRRFLISEPRIEEAVSSAQPCFKILRPGMAGALYYLFSDVDPGEAAIFFSDLAEGASLEAGDPLLALRERLLRIKMEKKTKTESEEVFLMCLRAWNRRRQKTAGATVFVRGSIVRAGGKRTYPKII